MHPLALLLASSPVSAAGLPPGQTIDNAVVIDVTADGLTAAESVVPLLMPEEFEVPDIHTEGDLIFGDEWWLDIRGIELQPEFDTVSITPGDGALWLDVEGTLKANSPSDPFNILLDSDWFEVADCDAWINPFGLEFSSSIALQVVEGQDGAYLDATVGDIAWEWSVTEDDLQLDCWVGDVEDILDWVGLSPYTLAIDYAEQELDGQLDALKPEIEAIVEASFGAANVEQDIDLGETRMHVSLHPASVDVSPDGVRVTAAGAFSADAHPCIEQYGLGGSYETPSSGPALQPGPHHLAAFASDDFLNQALFAAWRGGLLCYTISESDSLPLDTTLFSLISSDAYGALFPEPKPILVQTRPALVPLATPNGEHDVNVEIQSLGIDFMAELDHRPALILGADLDATAGADLNFDPSLGVLAIGIALDGGDIVPSIRHNEFAPGRDEELAAAFSGLFDTIVGPMLAGLLEGLEFPIASFEGVGLTELAVEPAGPDDDYFGFYANIGEVAYTNDSAGCGCGGEAEGCSAGCGTGALPGSAPAILSLVWFATARRRRR